MTLILAANGRESIWMVADRRLSRPFVPPIENGRKIMFLDTRDGVAMLGYAGLGATSRGTEPADWMSSVLRGRNFTIDDSLKTLCAALKRQFPKHLRTLQKGAPAEHNIVVPSIVNGQMRLYTIALGSAPSRQAYEVHYQRRALNCGGVMFCVSGSGSRYLDRRREWMRPLIRVIRAFDAKKVSASEVANHFARVNYRVHQNIPDNTVGPKCIVAWRCNRLGNHKGGGGHQFYDGVTREMNSTPLPIISGGVDMQALQQICTSHLLARMGPNWKFGDSFDLDIAAVNADVAKLPMHPDETLD